MDIKEELTKKLKEYMDYSGNDAYTITECILSPEFLELLLPMYEIDIDNLPGTPVNVNVSVAGRVVHKRDISDEIIELLRNAVKVKSI